MILCQFPDVKSIILTDSHIKRHLLLLASLPEGEQKASPFPHSYVDAAHSNLFSEMEGPFIPGFPTPEI